VPQGANDLLQRVVVKRKSYLMAAEKLENDGNNSAMRLLPIICLQDITTVGQ
jgi:hypothetical protein